jgi:anaerobic selenocysteine-containing dehydrogenase
MKTKSICRICKRRCGIIVETEGNSVVKVSGDRNNPRSKGYICQKGIAVPDTINSSERVLYPQKKNGDSWQRISWDEAYSGIADRLQSIKEQYGPESFDIFTGEGSLNERLNLYFERFGKIYGTPNHKTGGICHTVKMISNKLIFGTLLVPDFENSGCIILWGTNLDTAEPLNAITVRNAAKRGAKLIVIDPALTPMARKADIHLRIRPGTDGALALGMMNVLIRENLLDREFIENWTIGFKELSELASEYTPEKVSKITWVPAELIITAARTFGTVKPACIAYGNSTEHHSNAIQSMRAVSMLQALTGNVDIPGGGLIQKAIRLADPSNIECNNISARAIGEIEYPIYAENARGALGNRVADYIITGKPYPVRGVMVVGANPILTYPNSLKIQQAFKRLDFLAVYDMFMTQTARLADIVLPGAHFLERTELNVRDSDPIFCEKIVPPPGEARSSFEFIKGLFDVMGYSEHFPWYNAEESISFRLKPTGISLEQARKEPETAFITAPTYGKYKKNGFDTPSKKIELYSEKLRETGYDPLPVFTEPGESYYGDPELLNNYPYMLTTGARNIEYYHSQFRNNRTLISLVPEPLVDVHPELADKLGIGNGDRISLRSKRGSIEIKVNISEITHPRIMQMVEGWDEANMNILTDDSDLDPISGFPPLRSVMCSVKKIEKKDKDFHY